MASSQADRQAQTEIAGRQGMEGVQTPSVAQAPGFIANTFLVADKKIIGAEVYNLANEALGTVDDLVIDAPGSRVLYAVMSFGGFLGLGKNYHPVPWELLQYDPERDAFIVDLDRDRLKNAPIYGTDFDEWTRRYASEIDTYYNINRAPPAV